MPKQNRNSVSSQKPIEQYEHKDKERLNNPPVGLVDAHTDNGGYKKKTYQYDPHLDPQLQWASKAEHTSFDVPTVSLHVHERIDPRRIIETVDWVFVVVNIRNPATFHTLTLVAMWP